MGVISEWLAQGDPVCERAPLVNRSKLCDWEHILFHPRHNILEQLELPAPLRSSFATSTSQLLLSGTFFRWRQGRRAARALPRGG